MARSTDNGATWSFGDTLPYALESSLIVPGHWDNGVRLLALTYDIHSIIESRDNGQTWSHLYTVPDERWIDQVVHSDSIIALRFQAYNWAGGLPVHFIHMTTNNGTSWNVVEAPVSSDYANMALLGNELFGISGGHCVRLIGTTWEIRGEVPAENAYDFRMIAVTGDDDTLLVGVGLDPSVLWTSEDFGWTWRAREYVLPYNTQNAQLGQLLYDPYRHRLWAVAGVSTCYLDADELSTAGPLQLKPADYTLLSVYPNPFNAVARIRYDVLKSQRVELKVYDLEGRLVGVVADEIQAAGRYDVSRDLAEMASGTYFVHLVTPGMVKTEKVVLLK